MCRRALKIGLPALAFTEHLDLTGWVIDPEDLLDHLRPLVGDNGLLIPEPPTWLATSTVSSGVDDSFRSCAFSAESSSVSHTSTQTRRGSSLTSPHWIV